MPDTSSATDAFRALVVQPAPPVLKLLADERKVGKPQDQTGAELVIRCLEQEGVPDVLTQYSAAFAQAQSAQSEGDVISLERFARATRAMANTSDVQQSLKQLAKLW